MVFNGGYSHWTDSGWIPVLEITALQRLGHEETIGVTPLDHTAIRAASALRSANSVLRDTETLRESDRRPIAGTLGFRYALSDGQQWGAGFRFQWGLIAGGTIRLP